MENEHDDQLAIIAQARAAVADRLVTPWWYHPILGLLVAAYVVALGLAGTVWKIAAALLVIAACFALAERYRRMTGVWVSGLDAKGRAGWWAKGFGVLIGGLAAAAWGLSYWTDLAWIAWLLAPVAFVATMVLGRRFDTELRAQLRAGA